MKNRSTCNFSNNTKHSSRSGFWEVYIFSDLIIFKSSALHLIFDCPKMKFQLEPVLFRIKNVFEAHCLDFLTYRKLKKQIHSRLIQES